MKCLICGNDTFSAHQVCYVDVIVDSDGKFSSNLHDTMEASTYESDEPYGPFQCQNCGTEYESITTSEDEAARYMDVSEVEVVSVPESSGVKDCVLPQFLNVSQDGTVTALVKKSFWKEHGHMAQTHEEAALIALAYENDALVAFVCDEEVA